MSFNYDNWKLAAPTISDNPFENNLGQTVVFYYIKAGRWEPVIGILEDYDWNSITVRIGSENRTYLLEHIRK